MFAHRMVSTLALAAFLPLVTLAVPRRSSSASTVGNKTEIIAYVFPRGRAVRPDEVAAKKLHAHQLYTFANGWQRAK